MPRKASSVNKPTVSSKKTVTVTKSKASPPKRKRAPKGRGMAGNNNNNKRIGSSVPVAYKPRNLMHKSMVLSKNGRELHVRACEPVISLLSSSAFNLSYDEYINPCNPTLFPILSKEAVLYDKWRLNSLRIRYEPKCPTSQTGQIGLLILPDVETAEAPNSMINLEYYVHSSTTAAWVASETAYYRPLDSERWYYTATPAEFTAATMGTKRTQSNGVVQLFAQGASADSALCGTVYVDYDITLTERRPPLVSGMSFSTPITSFSSTVNKIIQTANPTEIKSAYGDITADFLSRSLVNLVGRGLATASYQTYTPGGSLLPLTNWMKLNTGFTRLGFGFNFGATNTGPLGLSRPKLVRQIAHSSPSLDGMELSDLKEDYALVDSPRSNPKSEEKHKASKVKKPSLPDPPEGVSFYALDYRNDGVYVKMDAFSDWVPYPFEAVSKKIQAIQDYRKSSPMADNDFGWAVMSYQPYNDTTVIVDSAGPLNTATAFHLSKVVDITQNSDYPLYITSYGTASMGVAHYRDYATDVFLISDDRRNLD